MYARHCARLARLTALTASIQAFRAREETAAAGAAWHAWIRPSGRSAALQTVSDSCAGLVGVCGAAGRVWCCRAGGIVGVEVMMTTPRVYSTYGDVDQRVRSGGLEACVGSHARAVL